MRLAPFQGLLDPKGGEVSTEVDLDEDSWTFDLAFRARGDVATELGRRELREDERLGDKAEVEMIFHAAG